MIPKPKSFNFKKYRTSQRNIYFDYEVEFSNRDPLLFTETITLPRLSNKKISDVFLIPLHLILGISYFKLYFPSKINIPYKLDKEQAEFWNTVYRKGLGEFMYRNKLDPEKIAKFPSTKCDNKPKRIDTKDKYLLGIGGGKDSIVSAELLREYDITSFLVETQKKDRISEDVIKKIGNPKLKIKRELDPKIFGEHPGSYNGHIPISAIFAFLGLLSCGIYGYKYTIVGNEHSSSFGNIKYKGEEVNHQWSKSIEFEKLIQNYTRKYISPDIKYFSVLRQFHEIRIAKMFSEHKKYHKHFSSCNRNFKVHKKRPDTLWCGHCSKCAFVFLMLSPFLSKKDLFNIFKKNLFEDKELLPLFTDILGFGKMKPFDCVGTFEEAQTALSLSSKRYKDTYIVKSLLPKVGKIDEENVFKTSKSLTLPTPFRFLGIDNICIVGYGREGKINEKYLKKNYPNLKIGILDKKRDKNYLEKQGNYDLAIKTVGIPKEKISVPYVTGTNIFFSENNNFKIGITGSKGKSTTSSLIYQIIKESGKKVRFVGNIGKPMLDTPSKKNEIFVIELSSYMLDDIEYSPNIAVLLNLFPDHMDYHGTIENYYNAKRNIFKFQHDGYISIKEPFKEIIQFDKKKIPIQGNHNLKNIKAATLVAKELGISNSIIKEAVYNFKPLPHRLELVGEYNNILFYNDAISTTPESTIEAIKTLKNVKTILLGGEDRGYDFRELEKTLRKYKIENIVLFPNSGEHILKSKKGFNIKETKSMREAVRFAYKNTPKNKICLLSTASPSYSIWKNFEEKGDLFKKYINELQE